MATVDAVEGAGAGMCNVRLLIAIAIALGYASLAFAIARAMRFSASVSQLRWLMRWIRPCVSVRCTQRAAYTAAADDSAVSLKATLSKPSNSTSPVSTWALIPRTCPRSR